MKLLINQIAGLKEKRSVIEAHRTEIETDLRIRYAVDFFESSSSDLTEWNAFLMRQLIDWVKILSAGPPQEDYFIDYSDAGFASPQSYRAG